MDVLSHLGAAGSADGAVADLTIGYRVPAPILDVANRLLPLTGVDAAESRSVRAVGRRPLWLRADHDEIAAQAARAVLDGRSRHKLTGLIAPPGRLASLQAELAAAGLVPVDHVHELGPDEVPVFGPERVKGLEFDGVVVVYPDEILHEGSTDPTARGARLLYVAMTRAVQELVFVTSAEPPSVIADRG